MSKRRQVSSDGVNWLNVEPDAFNFDASIYGHSREVDVGGAADVEAPALVAGVSPERGAMQIFCERQLAIFEALRRLGIPSDDIYVAFYNGGELFTEVRQGDLRFYISISQGQKLDGRAYEVLWVEKTKDWNEGPEDLRQEIYFKNLPPGFGVSLIMGLKDKGFVIDTKSGGRW